MYMARDMEGQSYKGQQAGQWADSSSGKAAQTKALGIMINWDQECRRVSPDPLGPLRIDTSAQLWTLRLCFPT